METINRWEIVGLSGEALKTFRRQSRSKAGLKMWTMIFMVLLFTASSDAQNSEITWSIFNCSFSFSKNETAGIISEGGQNFIGISIGNDTKVTAGFLAGHPYSLTDISDKEKAFPKKFELSQNYPNPFNPSTVIGYQIPVISHVSLKVYDILGREVATLVNGEKPAGNYKVNFDASGISSGVYFYKLTAGDFMKTRKMILLH